MKLTTVFLLVTLVQVSAAGLAQTITYREKNASLEQVFREIRRQTDFNVLATAENLAAAGRRDVNFQGASVEEVLRVCLAGTGLVYAIEKRTILIKERPVVLKDRDVEVSRQLSVRGRVTDTVGAPLPGVTVRVEGTSNGAFTDKDGGYVLENVGEDAVLRFSMVGFEELDVPVNGRAVVEVVMKVSLSALDEVQVIAYGTTTRRLSTGNISTVKAEDIAKQPVSNPLLTLAGRIPGLVIKQGSGLPNGNIEVRIQGQNSISSGNDPFIVIDGVPYSSEPLPNLAQIYGSGWNNPLSFINSSDIERIDVLKDADATAIYGSRAANGAILITTKKGQSGKTNININLQTGLGEITKKAKLLNTEQYLEMRREAHKNDGVQIGSVEGDSDQDFYLWDSNRYTDWQEELIGRTAQYNDFQASIGGGSQNTTFMINGGYHKETTVLPGHFGNQKGSIRFNLNTTSSNERFKGVFTGGYLTDRNSLPTRNFVDFALQLPPNAPPLFSKDGTLNWAPFSDGVSSWDNPLASIFQKYEVQSKNLIGSGIISYHIIPGLELKASFGYTDLQQEEISYSSIKGVKPENILSYINNRSSKFGDGSVKSWIVEPQLNFNRKLFGGLFNVMVGGTFQDSRAARVQLRGTGYSSDQLVKNISFAPNVRAESVTNTIYRYSAVFGRINYSFDNKYIVNLTGRRDGSSRFGPGSQFNNFGSVGLSWIFSDEPFFQRNLSFISFGKFNLSYGTTGNDKIGDYRFLSTYGVINAQNPYQGRTGLRPDNIPNPYLEWEETQKLQAGAYIGLFNQQIQLDIVAYRNRSSNQLLSFPLSDITGFGGVVTNLPATVQNSGWEFMANITNVKTKDFQWTSGLNLTIAKNKLLDFPGIEKSSYANSLVVGKPISITRVNQFAGVDQETGRYQFMDRNGELTFTPSFEDRLVLINTQPTLYGGIQNQFSFKGIQLDFLFEYRKQNGHNMFYGMYPGVFARTGNMGNQPISVLDRWQEPGDIAPVGKYGTVSNFEYQISSLNMTNSNAAWADASFIRLRNLSLSWKLPISRDKFPLDNIRVFLMGQNLLTITNYVGLDPESGRGVPPLRVFMFGVKMRIY